ncbi:MAG: hypothetical protein H0W96_01130, partial [Solirubrobacterales bacterium]|nr:hypothetical protein [Solirubrobacterales bacterium]
MGHRLTPLANTMLAEMLAGFEGRPGSGASALNDPAALESQDASESIEVLVVVQNADAALGGGRRDQRI